MAHFKRKRVTQSRKNKRKGFIVKGVTKRHWWDRYEKDDEQGSRGLLKKELRKMLEEE